MRLAWALITATYHLAALPKLDLDYHCGRARANVSGTMWKPSADNQRNESFVIILTVWDGNHSLGWCDNQNLGFKIQTIRKRKCDI